MECAYCYGKCSRVYALGQTTRNVMCSRACHQAYEAERLNSLLGKKIKFLEEFGKDPTDPMPKSIFRLYSTEIIFIRALLKGTTKAKLEQLKTIFMERWVDLIEESTTMGDSIYKNMADGSKKIIDFYDTWIKVFGN